MTERRAWAWVAALAYLAAVVSTIGLGRPALWMDEIHSFEFSALPTAGLVVLNAAVRDAYPPLYFLLLHAWMTLGSDEVWLRMLSVVLHVATVPLFYLVARRLVPRAEAVLAAGLFAFSPLHLAFAREVRMYALDAALAVLAVWGALRWVQDRSRGGFAVMTLAGIALLYTHFMGALVLLALAGFFWHDGRWRKPTAGRTAWAWALLTAAAFVPWAPLFLKAAVVTRGYGATVPMWAEVTGFLGALGAGFGHPRWVFDLGVFAAFWFSVGGALRLEPGRAKSLLLWWAFLPPFVELLAGALGKPVFSERTLICCSPAWVLLMAVGLREGLVRWHRAAGLALAGGLLAANVALTLLVTVPEAPRTRDLVAQIASFTAPGDVVVHSSTVTYHPVHLYYGPRSATPFADYLLEPQGEFHGGRLGERFREVWRAARARLDPGGVIRSGPDPNRIADADFLKLRWKRIWYLRTDEEGQRRLWLLQPSMYYFAPPETFPVASLLDHPRIRARVRKQSETVYPGCVLELYRRL